MLQIGGQMAQKPTFIPNCAILGYNYYCSKHKLYCLYDINFLSRRSTSRSISGIAQQRSIVTKVMNIPEKSITFVLIILKSMLICLAPASECTMAESILVPLAIISPNNPP